MVKRNLIGFVTNILSAFMIASISFCAYIGIRERFTKIDLGVVSELCDNFVNATVLGENIQLNFKLYLNDSMVSEIPKFFVYETSAFGSTLIFDKNSANVISNSGNAVSITFDYPFIQEYNGKLMCIPKNAQKRHNSYLSIAESLEDVSINVTKFLKSSEFTQMKCFHDKSHRYCRARNLMFYGGVYYFYTPHKYHFPTNFLSLSSWPMPYHYERWSFSDNPKVVNFDPLQGKKDYIEMYNTSYIFNRFFNLGMLWHSIYDTLVPLHHTIEEIEGKVISRNRNIFFCDFYSAEIYKELFEPFSENPLVSLYLSMDNFLWRDCIIGLKKFTVKPRIYTETINHEYIPEELNSTGTRDIIFRHLKINPTINHTRPEIMFPMRYTSSRNVKNMAQIYEYVRHVCPWCNVNYVNPASYSLQNQLKIFSNVSVIIGAHGSALAHVAWMPPSTKKYKTALIEILPYNYRSRPWYANAAAGAGIHYYNIEGKKPNITENLCFRPYQNVNPLCHDIVRDQEIDVDIIQFGLIFENVMDQLRVNRLLYQKERA